MINAMKNFALLGRRSLQVALSRRSIFTVNTRQLIPFSPFYKHQARASLCSSSVLGCNSDRNLIREIDYLPRDRMVSLHWHDGKDDMFPMVWLRDSCLCSECHNTSSKSRLLLLKDLNTKEDLADIQVTEDGTCLKLTWSDGHRSEFQAEWLRNKSFNPKDQLERLERDDPPKELWDKTYVIPRFRYEEVISDDSILYNFLATLNKSGLVMLKECPTSETIGALNELSERVVHSNIQQTCYGKTFSVADKPDPQNTAYTNCALNFHTDLCYYKHSPDVEILHCVRQCTSGGANEIADGFHAVKLLQQQNPKAYNLLTTVPVDHSDAGFNDYEFHISYRRPVIGTDVRGRVTGVYFSQQLRSYTLNVPLKQVQALYDAFVELNKIFHDNAVRIRMESGDMLVFDNERVVHNRETIWSDSGEGRCLASYYWTWDEVKSRMRVIQQQLTT